MKNHLTFLATLVAATAVNAEVVYDNTGTFRGSRSFSQLQQGDEVNPAGISRTIVELLIGVNQQGFAGTADLQARLYANDGPGGEPGTMLWESALMDDVPLSGGDDLVSFTVPGIEVPDPFTWTIQISDTSPVAAGLPHYGPPSVGGSPDYAWFGAPGSWTKLDLQNPVDFMCRIITAEACPEDVDESGAVEFGDILVILGAWGPYDPCPPYVRADIDQDCEVAFADLIRILAAWGACP